MLTFTLYYVNGYCFNHEGVNKYQLILVCMLGVNCSFTRNNIHSSLFGIQTTTKRIAGIERGENNIKRLPNNGRPSEYT